MKKSLKSFLLVTCLAGVWFAVGYEAAVLKHKHNCKTYVPIVDTLHAHDLLRYGGRMESIDKDTTDAVDTVLLHSIDTVIYQWMYEMFQENETYIELNYLENLRQS